MIVLHDNLHYVVCINYFFTISLDHYAFFEGNTIEKQLTAYPDVWII